MHYHVLIDTYPNPAQKFAYLTNFAFSTQPAPTVLLCGFERVKLFVCAVCLAAWDDLGSFSCLVFA